MGLNDSQLETDILAILDGTVSLPTVADAGDAWGDAIHDYSVDGEVENPAMTFIPSVGLDLRLPALKTALTGGFSTLPGDPNTVASAITAALDIYWAGILFSTGVAAPSGSALLITNLTVIFENIGGTHASKATEIRDEFAAYTKAVLVTFPPPPPGPPAGVFPVQ